MIKKLKHFYNRYKSINRFSQNTFRTLELLWYFRLAGATYLRGAIKKDADRLKTLSLNIFNKKTPVFFRPTQGDLLIFNEVFIEEHYALPDSISKFQTIIDLGSNVGYSSLYFLRKYNPSKIILVEPSERNLLVASRNLENWIAAKQCYVYQAAAHYEKGTVYLDEGLAPYNFKTHLIAKDRRAINTVTIPDIIRDHNMDIVDILKIDIEGAELYLFQQNTEWLSQVKTIVIELHLPLDFIWLKRILDPYGFEIVSDTKNKTPFVAINKRFVGLD